MRQKKYKNKNGINVDKKHERFKSRYKKSVIRWMSEQQKKHGDVYFRTCDIATSMKLTSEHARDILNELYDADILDYIPPYRGIPLLWFIKSAPVTG